MTHPAPQFAPMANDLDTALDIGQISREHPAFKVAFQGINAAYWMGCSVESRQHMIDEYHALVADDFDGESE
jgi:hypothetical protein